MLLRRILLAALVALVSLLVAEGALSLLAGRSLRGPAAQQGWPDLLSREQAGTAGRPQGGTFPGDDPSAELAPEQSSGRGPFVSHLDPGVRYVLQPNATVQVAGITLRTDEHGMRARPGPPPPANALRVVVLGDSVAFGWGVNDAQTLAACLERVLAEIRGQTARAVACFTVAVPSWNHRNAARFLLDHWDTYRADVVVYVPVVNDLSGSVALDASGQQVLAPDPAEPDPWLLVSHSQQIQVEHALLARARESGALREPPAQSHYGPLALVADLSAESQRRYDENAATLADLAARLALQGSRLLVVQSGLAEYALHLAARLADVAPEVAVLRLEERIPKEHPDAATLVVRARWVAEDLIARGWIDGGDLLRLPPVPELFRRMRASPARPEELLAESERVRQRAREMLLDAIDVRTVAGIRQVFGGLNQGGSARMRLLALLRAGGPRLTVALAPLAERPDLYPLTVAVEIAGQPAGTIVVLPQEEVAADFPLPPDVTPGSPFEVRLAPERWCVVREQGREVVASFRPLRLECRAE